MVLKETFQERPMDPFLREMLLWVTLLLVMVSLVKILSYFHGVMTLLGLTIVITYILLGPVNVLESWILGFSAWFHRIPGLGPLLRYSPEVSPRILSVTIIYTIFFTVVFLVLVFLLPLLLYQLQGFIQAIPEYIQKVQQVFSSWIIRLFGENILSDFMVLPKASSAHASGMATNLIQTPALLQQTVSNAVDQVYMLLTGSINGFLYWVSGCVLVFYFLLDGHSIKSGMIRVLPESVQKTGRYFLSRFHQIMFAFVKGQVMLGLLTGIYMFIVYSVFQVKYAFFLSSLFAVAEFLPVVGTWIGITPGIVVILFSSNPLTLIPVWVVSYLFQTVKDNILAPKIVGDVMGLHPVVVILSLIICAKLAGLLGILMALPLASLIHTGLSYVFHPLDREEGTLC